MSKVSLNVGKAARKGSPKLGRERALAYSRIEGLILSPRMRQAFEAYEADGLSSEERRERIRTEFSEKR